jgi:hypothetical protein
MELHDNVAELCALLEKHKDALKAPYGLGKYQAKNRDNIILFDFSGRESVAEREIFAAFLAAIPNLASDFATLQQAVKDFEELTAPAIKAEAPTDVKAAAKK